jgi:hypothetical protein
MSRADRESRKYPRLESRHAVLVRRLAGDLEELAPTKTIAIGGCCLVTDEPLGVGSVVELLITVDHRVIQARGRVVYESPSDDGRSETGVEFVQLDDDAQAAIIGLFQKDVNEVSSSPGGETR